MMGGVGLILVDFEIGVVVGLFEEFVLFIDDTNSPFCCCCVCKYVSCYVSFAETKVSRRF